MKEKNIQVSYKEYESADELGEADIALLALARDTTKNAYAPYSHFHVGAAARLVNGQMVTGTNQENASYPVGICAERVLLSAASSLYPGVAIDTLAISYHNINGKSAKPVAPCGICRQSLSEFENRTHHPIRIVLAGLEGKVIELHTAADLLPLSFSDNDLLKG